MKKHILVPNIPLLEAFERLRAGCGRYNYDRATGLFKRPDGTLTLANGRRPPTAVRKSLRNKYRFMKPEAV